MSVYLSAGNFQNEIAMNLKYYMQPERKLLRHMVWRSVTSQEGGVSLVSWLLIRLTIRNHIINGVSLVLKRLGHPDPFPGDSPTLINHLGYPWGEDERTHLFEKEMQNTKPSIFYSFSAFEGSRTCPDPEGIYMKKGCRLPYLPWAMQKVFGVRGPLFCAPRKHGRAETANDCLHGVSQPHCAPAHGSVTAGAHDKYSLTSDVYHAVHCALHLWLTGTNQARSGTRKFVSNSRGAHCRQVTGGVCAEYGGAWYDAADRLRKLLTRLHALLSQPQRELNKLPAIVLPLRATYYILHYLFWANFASPPSTPIKLRFHQYQQFPVPVPDPDVASGSSPSIVLYLPSASGRCRPQLQLQPFRGSRYNIVPPLSNRGVLGGLRRPPVKNYCPRPLTPRVSRMLSPSLRKQDLKKRCNILRLVKWKGNLWEAKVSYPFPKTGPACAPNDWGQGVTTGQGMTRTLTA
ncbi:hypothetical protein J6590_022625 [Homalodisca vitripennis]|nr:hypothetical protein J6590_022625 [Homalodisca vitripennis]